MKVTLLDTQTGETIVDQSSTTPFWWMDGNGSCDCNRMTFFGLDYGPDYVCVGSTRFLVIGVDDPQGHSLREFNPNYPEELLMKHLPTDPPIVLDALPPEILPQTAVALEDAYRGALIGQTIDPEPRFVYSLTALARIRSRQGNRSLEHARADVGHMVFDIREKHGDRAPVFVDDTVSQDRPKILRPGGRFIR